MGLISKFSYLRALLVGIPFGIGCLIIGINGFKNSPRSTRDLVLTDCVIISWEQTEKYYDYLESTMPILNINTTHGVFYVGGKDIVEQLSKSLLIFQKQDKMIAKIYTEPDDNLIKEFEISNSTLVQFDNALVVYHIFFWLGLVTLVSGGIYLIKHPEDLMKRLKK